MLPPNTHEDIFVKCLPSVMMGLHLGTGIARSYDSMVNFVGNWQTLPKQLPQLHVYLQGTEDSDLFFPREILSVVLLGSVVWAVLVGVMRYHTVVWAAKLWWPMTLTMAPRTFGPFGLHSSLEKWLFKFFAHFKIELFTFLLLSFKSSSHVLGTREMMCKYVLLSCGLSFQFLNRALSLRKVFNFKVRFIIFFGFLCFVCFDTYFLNIS